MNPPSLPPARAKRICLSLGPKRLTLCLLHGDVHLAQDVTQLVFTNLARKAHTLSSKVILAGWLHCDTCYTVLEIMRNRRGIVYLALNAPPRVLRWTSSK
jgi:hypothetical protein